LSSQGLGEIFGNSAFNRGVFNVFSKNGWSYCAKSLKEPFFRGISYELFLRLIVLFFMEGNRFLKIGLTVLFWFIRMLYFITDGILELMRWFGKNK